MSNKCIHLQSYTDWFLSCDAASRFSVKKLIMLVTACLINMTIDSFSGTPHYYWWEAVNTALIAKVTKAHISISDTESRILQY